MRISDWSSDVCSDLPPPGHAEQPQGFWQHRLFLAAIVLIAAVPLLLPDVPPLTVLPGHMVRYRVQLDLVDSPALPLYYRFLWALLVLLVIVLLFFSFVLPSFLLSLLPFSFSFFFF